MKHRVMGTLGGACAALVLQAAWAPPARAHETDNFYLPLDRPFADLGSLLDAVHARAITRTVESLNRQIDAALRIADSPARARRLEYLHDPRRVVSGVYAHFNDAFTEVLDLEDAVRGSWARAAYPGQRSAHWSADWMYTYIHFPLDPRRLILVWQSSTIKAHGVYFGTDKLSHFHHMGMFYYDRYRSLREGGMDHAAAARATAEWYSRTSPIGEDELLGFYATGVFSNADLAANYMGFKFFLNLTEPVDLKGATRPPLVHRCGEYWRIDTRVRPESGWFGDFISDHWNEALNPSLYDSTVRDNVKAILEERADRIVEFYATRDGRPRDPAYYDDLARRLATFEGGEPYGHSGQWDRLMTIGNTCLPALAARHDAAPTPGSHTP
jgi:hypothetical protein